MRPGSITAQETDVHLSPNRHFGFFLHLLKGTCSSSYYVIPSFPHKHPLIRATHLSRPVRCDTLPLPHWQIFWIADGALQPGLPTEEGRRWQRLFWKQPRCEFDLRPHIPLHVSLIACFKYERKCPPLPLMCLLLIRPSLSCTSLFMAPALSATCLPCSYRTAGPGGIV